MALVSLLSRHSGAPHLISAPDTLFLFHPNDLKRYLARHKEQEPQTQRRRLAHALRWREISRRRQGNELATGAGWKILALHPRLLGQAGHPRWFVATTGNPKSRLINFRRCPLLPKADIG